MDKSKFEKEILEKFKNRKIQPSASAWERLSHQLDTQEKKKKKGWFLYIGYAATIALIISVALLLNDKQSNESFTPENTIVTKEVKVPEIDPNLIKSVIKNDPERVVVDKPANIKIQKTLEKKVVKKQPFIQKKSVPLIAQQTIKPKSETTDKNTAIINIDPKETTTVVLNKTIEKIKVNKEPEFKKPEGTISVNSNALLYAVTHSKEDIRGYYKKYKISRANVLKTIEKELKKSKLSIDPNTILAEVERDVNEESFQNNFYRLIKKKVSDVATAIANRNN